MKPQKANCCSFLYSILLETKFYIEKSDYYLIEGGDWVRKRCGSAFGPLGFPRRGFLTGERESPRVK